MPEPREWPENGLDVARWRAAGRRPVPLSQYLVKVAARCNLACGYCYVYEHADTSWRHAARFLDPATARRLGRRMAEHAAAHGLDRLRVGLHGGEPLLAGAARLGAIVAAIRTEVAAGCAATVDFTVQTNGTLLDAAWLDRFAEWDVRVGVSLDGDAAAHDRQRGYPSGRSSRAAAESGVRLLTTPAYRHLFAGLLSVVDLAGRPADHLAALTAFRPPMLDVLLPHANWENPPARPAGSGPTPYGDWLCELFDLWYAAADPVPIRLFEALLDLCLGGDAARAGSGELLGLAPLGYVVVDTDGSYKQSDALNLAYDGCAATGLSVARNPVDDLLDLPGIAARQLGRAALPSGCRGCGIVEVCGGGHYGHRYRRGSGFRNPSVYCEDLKVLIGHARRRLTADLRAAEPDTADLVLANGAPLC